MASGYFDKYHIFRDPIHGYIKVYDFERDLINTPAFQRLRRIKQLGLTNLVYHGADHTRFAHSLGVMDLADRTVKILLGKPRLKRLLKWKNADVEKYRVLARILALLHDIGHSPLSHAGENELFPEGLDHKKYGARIVDQDGEISELLDAELRERHEIQIGKAEVSDFLDKGEVSPPILKQIIDGPLDVDKMDYLLRDSVYTGVQYGKFDLERLLHTLTVVKAPITEESELGIEEGGVYTAEALMLARYYMFLQVYFHPVRRAYDLHIAEFVKMELDRWPASVPEFLNLDDIALYELTRAQGEARGRKGDIARRILHRKHYEEVWETRCNIGKKEEAQFRERVKKLKKKFQLQEGEGCLVDKATDAPNKFRKQVFYCEVRSPRRKTLEEKYKDVEERSSMIQGFPNEVNIMRLYVPPEDEFREVRTWARKNKSDFM